MHERALRLVCVPHLKRQIDQRHHNGNAAHKTADAGQIGEAHAISPEIVSKGWPTKGRSSAFVTSLRRTATDSGLISSPFSSTFRGMSRPVIFHLCPETANQSPTLNDASSWWSKSAMTPRPVISNTSRIIPCIRRSHPEHAELRVADGGVEAGAQCKCQDAAGIGRGDDAVVPKAGGRVVGVALVFVFLADRRLEGLGLVRRPFVGVAMHGG